MTSERTVIQKGSAEELCPGEGYPPSGIETSPALRGAHILWLGRVSGDEEAGVELSGVLATRDDVAASLFLGDVDAVRAGERGDA